MSKRDEYIKKIQLELDNINIQLDSLESKAHSASAEMKDKYRMNLAKAKERSNEVKEKLTNIESSSEAAWEEMKVGLDNAWVSLKEAFNNAKSHF